jgi:hypothetical protein
VAVLARRQAGLLCWYAAARRKERGESLAPLLLHADTHRVPDWALRPPSPPEPPTPTHAQRARGDDPLIWWEVNGNPWELSAEEINELAKVIDPGLLRGTGGALNFEDALEALAGQGLSDFELARALESAWNGQAFLWAGQDIYEQVGVAGLFGLDNPWFYDYLREQSGYLIQGIDETTRAFTAELLWGASGGHGDLEYGASWAKTAQVVRQVSDQVGSELRAISAYRAELITLTELARAESFATMASLWTLGARQKIWLVNAEACKVCVGNAEAGNIPLTQDFPSGVQAPPAHPKCRCSVAGAVPDTFNPADWQGRPVQPFLDMLFLTTGGYFPDVDLPLDLGGTEGMLNRAARVAVVRTAPIAAPPRHLPAAARARERTLGAGLRRASASAAEVWLRAARAKAPESADALHTLATRAAEADALDAGSEAETQVFARADDAYWRWLRGGVSRAVAAYAHT